MSSKELNMRGAKLKKIFIIIYTAILTIIFGYYTSVLISYLFDKANSDLLDLISKNDFLILLILIPIFVLWFFVLYKIAKKFTLISIIVVTFFLVGWLFVFRPYKITGGNIGNYKDGDIVLSYSKKLLINRSVQRWDIVIFSSSRDFRLDGIGIVLGVPGDNGEGATYYSGESVGKTIPSGFYLIDFGGKLRAIPETNIKFIVWFPIKDSGPIPVRNPY